MALNDNIFLCLESGTQKAEKYLNNILWYLLRISDTFTKSILNKVFNNHIPEILKNHYSVQLQRARGGDIYDVAFIDNEGRTSLVFELKATSGEFNEQLVKYSSNLNTKIVLISPDISRGRRFKKGDISAISWSDIYEISMNASSRESDPVSRYLLKEFCGFLITHGLQRATLESLSNADIHKLKAICDNARKNIPHDSRPSGLKQSKTYQGYNIYVAKKRRNNEIVWGWGVSFVYSVKPTSPDCSGLVLFLWAWGVYDSHFCRALYENRSIRRMLEKESFKYGEDDYKPYWVKKLDIDYYKAKPIPEASITLSDDVSRTIEFLKSHQAEFRNFVKTTR